MKLKISGDIKHEINPGMIGLFFEDINYGLDGGLSAEMIENRSFEFYDAGGVKYGWHREYDGMYGWSSVKDCRLEIGTDGPVSGINPHFLTVSVDSEDASLANKAYDGICMRTGISYTVSLYMRAEYYLGQVFVDIVKDNVVEASAELKPIQGICADSSSAGSRDGMNGWDFCGAELSCSSDIMYGEFRIRFNMKGMVNLDFVSMKPSDAIYGVFRRDIADMLKDIKPGFLRFPGGCVVEGNTIENMYKWKETVGIPEDRRANWNRWAVHGNSRENGAHSEYSHYNQTLAVGYYEYFRLCEYIGAKPLPVCNVGMACQYESKELFELEDKKFASFIQDALDLIEFANGDITSEWGRLRAQMGHSESFGLELIGIGNEQWETKESRFFERYTLFEGAIHEKYPSIKLIGSAGPDVTSVHYTDAWSFYHEKEKQNSSFTYAVDEHYYVSPSWLIKNSDFYDKYSRETKVFAGEYAAHTDNDLKWAERNCFEAALSEAAFMTGLERNSDVVVMASYAPLLARIGYTQWAPDLIWFDAVSVYGSPSYYVQKLYSVMTGEYELEVLGEAVPDLVKYCASYDKTNGKLYLKLVNTLKEDVLLKLDIAPDMQVKAGRVSYMNGGLRDSNTINEPTRIAVKEKVIEVGSSIEYLLPAEEFHVIELDLV